MGEPQPPDNSLSRSKGLEFCGYSHEQRDRESKLRVDDAGYPTEGRVLCFSLLFRLVGWFALIIFVRGSFDTRRSLGIGNWRVDLYRYHLPIPTDVVVVAENQMESIGVVTT